MSQYYSKKEILLRIVWSMVRPVFFNCSPRLLYGWRNFILRVMGARIGKGVKIFPSAIVTYPWLLEIGDRAIVSWKVRIYNLGPVHIGKDSVISQYAHLCGGTHDYALPGFRLIRSGLYVGAGVWIAADAFIGPGVRVNDDAIVGARAVVTSDVQSGTIVGGNPAKTIKKISRLVKE
jgi:putative colanic acid biosynthesis acetyltransferase WcaF